MFRSTRRIRLSIVIGMLLCCLQACPSHLLAESPVKMKHFAGILDFSAPGPVIFTMEGEASHLGRFTSLGEVVFTPGRDPGTEVGTGVIVIRAANGDLLVGNMVWSLSAPLNNQRTASIHFRWSDSITLSNGTVVTNTGRFVDDRPAGLVIDAKTEAGLRLLIAILGPILRK